MALWWLSDVFVLSWVSSLPMAERVRCGVSSQRGFVYWHTGLSWHIFFCGCVSEGIPIIFQQSKTSKLSCRIVTVITTKCIKNDEIQRTLA